jgi:hypothetical protein
LGICIALCSLDYFLITLSALPQSIQLALNSLNDDELKGELLQNIVLSGGGSTIYGFHKKLEQVCEKDWKCFMIANN